MIKSFLRDQSVTKETHWESENFSTDKVKNIHHKRQKEVIGEESRSLKMTLGFELLLPFAFGCNQGRQVFYKLLNRTKRRPIVLLLESSKLIIMLLCH